MGTSRFRAGSGLLPNWAGFQMNFSFSAFLFLSLFAFERNTFSLTFASDISMSILHYFEFIVGRLLYACRGHDVHQIIRSPAFKEFPEPNMRLESPECGPSGSKLPLHCSCLAYDGRGYLPELRWTPPNCREQVQEYVLICEDLDAPIPLLVFHHGLLWAIPASTLSACPEDVKPDEHAKISRQTTAGWRFVPNMLGTPYAGAGAPLGHGSHRYVFTIVALNASLKFKSPEGTTKNDIKRAMEGKVIGWGQWTGVFAKPWPK